MIRPYKGILPQVPATAFVEGLPTSPQRKEAKKAGKQEAKEAA